MRTCQELGQANSQLVPQLVPGHRKNDEHAPSGGLVDEAEVKGLKPVETDFAAALLMLATLPLSEQERAEAVRRLLSGHE